MKGEDSGESGSDNNDFSIQRPSGSAVTTMGPGAPSASNSAGLCAAHVGDPSGTILDLDAGSSGLVLVLVSLSTDALPAKPC